MLTELIDDRRAAGTIIPGLVERLPNDEVKVPHMGGNTLTVERDHPLVDGIEDGEYAHFVHPYGSEVASHTVASCDYGLDVAAIAANERGNVLGA